MGVLLLHGNVPIARDADTAAERTISPGKTVPMHSRTRSSSIT